MGCSCSSSIEEGGRKKNRTNENKNKNEEHLNLNSGKKNLKTNENPNNNNKNLIENKNNKNDFFLKNSIAEEENKIIVPPAVKEYIVEGNDIKEDKSYKKRTYKGLTILENIKEYIPENISRDYIKDMVYNCLSGNIVKNKSEYIKGKNLTYDQVEGIIDTLFKIVVENEIIEKKEIEDERLNDVNVKINFYDANEENIRKFIYRGKNPSDEEVTNTLNQFNSGGVETKILAIELEE